MSLCVFVCVQDLMLGVFFKEIIIVRIVEDYFSQKFFGYVIDIKFILKELLSIV